MKKADGSAFGLAVCEPRSLRSRGCWCYTAILRKAQLNLLDLGRVSRTEGILDLIWQIGDY